MRVKGGSAPRRSKNRVLKEAKGFWGKRKNCWKMARIAVRRSKQQAFTGRKQRKRNLRALWIQRLNAATRARGLSYSRFVHGLGKANIELDRKSLSEIAIHDPQGFDAVFEVVKRYV
ncbi:MAG: 50S ribosomal protein L20 [Planctomycetota bacterium]